MAAYADTTAATDPHDPTETTGINPSEADPSENDPSETDPSEMEPIGGTILGFLEECPLDDPCPELELYCDYDGCSADAGEDDECVWARLRDESVVRLQIFDALASEKPFAVVPLGDGERGALRESLDGTGTIVRCTLADAAFFQGWIDVRTDVSGVRTAGYQSCSPTVNDAV